MEINKTDSYGNTQGVNVNYCRMVSDKIYLPSYDCTWEILYKTNPIEIGPLEKIVVFKVADAFANGEKVCNDTVRKLLHQHKPNSYNLTLST